MNDKEKNTSASQGSSFSCTFQAEIAERASMITDKLEFLEVSRQGLSQLQVLLIETEVCICLYTGICYDPANMRREA